MCEYFWNDNVWNIENFLINLRKKIPNDETLIVLNGACQCLPEVESYIEKINQFVDSIPNKLILLTGKLTSDLTIEPKFYYKRIKLFDRISTIYWKLNNTYYPGEYQDLHTHILREKKFYWASNNDNYPRRYLLDGLYRANLIDSNLVNYKCGISNLNLGGWVQESLDPLSEAKANTDAIVPLPPLDDTVEFNVTPLSLLKSSYLQICLETYYPQGLFFSEKVFNSINHYQLFFHIGYVNSLKYLRESGYETFENLFDLSYDTIENPWQRLKAARQSLLDYLDKPLEEIQNDYINSIPKILHNKNLVLKQRPDLELKHYFLDVYND